MGRYNFNLARKELLDRIKSPYIYEYNLAENLALLSNDVAIIRRFYQMDIGKYFKDQWLVMETQHKFMANQTGGEAFAYFGLIPMIVQGKVNLVASNGFVCKSDDEEVDEILNRIKVESEIEQKFADGVYLESGLGDFLYRVSYHKELSDKPIIDIISAERFEVNYKCGRISSIVIKEVSNIDPTYELREIHFKDTNGYACMRYRFWRDGKYIPTDAEQEIKVARDKFDNGKDIDLETRVFPFRDLLVIYKQNNNRSKMYKGERGVPDIQGLATIEDALTETLSSLIDAIRKGGVWAFVNEDLIVQDQDGQRGTFNPFKRTVVTTKGSSTPGESGKLYEVEQGQINWEAYTRTMQQLMSVAINKVGLAPTTLGLTGLESINSSAESQDAREKTSLRTRDLCLNTWKPVLRDLFNRYLQMCDYIEGRSIIDYSDEINISFNEYTSPSVENITDILIKQVQNGLKSKQTAMQELNDGLSAEQIQQEIEQIKAENQPAIEESGVNENGVWEEEKKIIGQ